MNHSAFGDIALELGWQRHGEATYTFRVGDRMAAVTPFERKLPNATMLDLGELCYSDEMIRAVDFVFGSPTDWGSLAKRRPPTRSTLTTMNASSVDALLQGVIAWATSVDRLAALEYLAGLEGEVDPGTAVQHIVALGLLGRTEPLEDYLAHIRVGGRAELSLAISEDMVQRALELAPVGQSAAG